ncbi:MAG: hypothetical protein H0U24_02265 [Thermoleophilaceae bacterium]|nr:hypothetical protein [Thermoleophilaceae bacterium]
MADGFYTEHVSAGVLSEPSLDRVRTREEEHVTAELACAAPRRARQGQPVRLHQAFEPPARSGPVNAMHRESDAALDRADSLDAGRVIDLDP